MKKKNKIEGLILPDFKTDGEATVIKTLRCRHPWHGLESPEINVHIYGEMTSTKGPKPPNGGKTVFRQSVLKIMDIHMSKNKAGPVPYATWKN